MGKPVETAFKAVCEAKRNADFAKDTFVDGRTFLQDNAIRTIFKTYPIVNVVETTFNNSVLFYYVSTSCRRLLVFKINSLGLFTLSIVPVFGGVNTPYQKPLSLTKNKQLLCV